MTTCTWHPDRVAIVWVPIEGDGAESAKAPLCAECAPDTPSSGGLVGSGELGTFALVKRGKPCNCGPGFCASVAGIGHIGTCGGSRKTSAPDCGNCGAPHQSAAGCWLCNGKTDPVVTAAFLRLLRSGVDGHAAYNLVHGMTQTPLSEAMDLAIEMLGGAAD